MPLPLPQLDNRDFQSLVDEAKRRITTLCPEWTDHNVSDPGVTLIELFAGMIDVLIYRLNQVPEKNYLAFMNLLGVRRNSPIAATVQISFYLTVEARAPRLIPSGVEVETNLRFGTNATDQQMPMRSEWSAENTETEQQTVRFTTDSVWTINPLVEVPICLTRANGSEAYEDQTASARDGYTDVIAFTKQPVVGDCFYLGQAIDISRYIVRIDLECRDVKGLGIIPSAPPIQWEAWCGEQIGWVAVDAVEEDTTQGFNANGSTVIRLPPGIQQRNLKSYQAFWVRCRFIERPNNQYKETPRFGKIRMHAIGATIPASHATSITNEILGISNGNPGQTFQLEQHPILARRPEERIEVREPGSENWVPWIEVEHFYRSTGRDRHYTLDGFTGEIAFGPTIREPQGVERIYGARPLTGSTIRMSRYRVGGGTIGNAGPLTISQLKTSVPYVDRVINHAAAQHGLDAEQLEQTMLRAPHELWNSERAVTTADYEFLALKASPRVARASCIQPGAAAANQINSGVVRVVIVPRVDQPDRIDPQHPEQAWKPDDDTPLKDVHAFLSERRLLTTQLVVEWPEYVLVSIHANLRAIRGSDPKTIETEALRRLYRFLNPLVGGPQGDGWPFGRNLTIASIYAQLQNIADLEEIESVQIRVGNQAISATTVAVGINAVVRSGEHRITVKRAGVP